MFFGFPNLFDEDDLLEKQLEDEDANDGDNDLKCKICGSDTVAYLSAFPASRKTPVMVCPRLECCKK